MARGPWPDQARAAVLYLVAEAAGPGATTDRIRLLIDCRAAVGTEPAIPTTVLLQRLKADLEAPWFDYGPGHGGISAAKPRRGYQRADFLDTWRRYTPTLATGGGLTSPQCVIGGT